MTGLAVTPIIPPSMRGKRRSGQSPNRAAYRHVTVPRLHAIRERSSTYGVAALDDRGRIADRLILASLGWVPGTRLTIAERIGLVVVSVDAAGSSKVTPQGHLRLPASIRHWCGLVAGSRVLLVADPPLGRLLIHPPESIDTMVTGLYAAVFGGDAA